MVLWIYFLKRYGVLTLLVLTLVSPIQGQHNFAAELTLSSELQNSTSISWSITHHDSTIPSNFEVLDNNSIITVTLLKDGLEITPDSELDESFSFHINNEAVDPEIYRDMIFTLLRPNRLTNDTHTHNYFISLANQDQLNPLIDWNYVDQEEYVEEVDRYFYSQSRWIYSSGILNVYYLENGEGSITVRRTEYSDSVNIMKLGYSPSLESGMVLNWNYRRMYQIPQGPQITTFNITTIITESFLKSNARYPKIGLKHLLVYINGSLIDPNLSPQYAHFVSLMFAPIKIVYSNGTTIDLVDLGEEKGFSPFSNNEPFGDISLYQSYGEVYSETVDDFIFKHQLIQVENGIRLYYNQNTSATQSVERTWLILQDFSFNGLTSIQFPVSTEDTNDDTPQTDATRDDRKPVRLSSSLIGYPLLIGFTIVIVVRKYKSKNV